MEYTRIFKNKKVLVTGHTGFKGYWLTLWLIKIGAKVYGISLNKHNNKSKKIELFYKKNVQNHYFDISDQNKTKKIIKSIKPDYIFHLAAQSIVVKSYNDPSFTWMTNVIGTQSILESLKYINKNCVCVFITSDKCYENKEVIRGYKETDRLGGSDPYSSSKAACEILIKSYYESYFSKKNQVKISTARAGNVIGGNDWSEYRLIPDVVKSWSKNIKTTIRNPLSTRPWQHVLEPISGYMLLAYKITKNQSLNGESFNFGPSSLQKYTVEFIIKHCSSLWDNKKWKVLKNKYNETTLLSLNSKKAYDKLRWKSKLNIYQTLELTINWYKCYFNSQEDIIKYSNSQIDYYQHKNKIDAK